MKLFAIHLWIGPSAAEHNENLSGDEIAIVNFYAVCPEATRIRWNNAK